MHSVPRKTSLQPLSGEDTLSSLLDLLPQPALFAGTDGAIIAANDPFCETVGRKSRSGDTIADLPHPGDRSRLMSLLAAVSLAEHPLPATELRLPSPDGTWKWHLLSVAPRRFGGTRGILAQFTDISALKARESDLESRESRWDRALVSSSAGVWDHNFSTGEMFYSDKWREIRGLSPEDPLTTSAEEWLAGIHPDDRDRVRFAIERQNEGDPAFMSFEYRERHKDGHWVWIECRGNCAERDETGKPLRIIGIDIDVTQRKAAEEMLTRMSHRLELALDTSNIGIFEADLLTRQVYWDDNLIKIYGLDGQGRELPDGTWQSLLHPDDYDRSVAHTDAVLAGEETAPNQFRIFRRNDGTIRHLRTRATTYIDHNGRRKILGVTWDVSDDVYLTQQLDQAKRLAEARNGELEAAKARIEHIALHDHLTELPNRRFLDEQLERIEAACARTGEPLAVLHIDLDRFKQINDTLGHTAGDMMLRHAAKILRANIRENDFVARIGGDEFVFLVRGDVSEKKLAQLADRIIAEMRKPVHFEGHECRFGTSIGIAIGRAHPFDARQLLLNADIALYHAKNQGRNRHEFFSPQTHSQLVNVKRISDDILRGLEKDEFVPFYQFQFCAKTLDVVGVETLARWHHPEKGILTPEYFLRVADDLDVVATIDGIILDKALADFRRWQAGGHNVPKLSVNVSSRRLHDPDLRKKLRSIDAEPGTLSFELLESIFLDDFGDQVKRNLKHLRKLGIELEIDDFGTGHASIVSLLRLRPSAFKIDRELVQRVTVSREERKMVRSIIELGHSLDIRVVAEGVETCDHARILKELDCDVLQGYGLALPMPFETTEAFLADKQWLCARAAEARKK